MLYPRLIAVLISGMMSGCFVTMSKPIKTDADAGIYVSEDIPETYMRQSAQINKRDGRDSTVLYERSLYKNGKIDSTMLFLPNAGIMTMSPISHTKPIEKFEIEKIEQLLDYHQKASVDQLINSLINNGTLSANLHHRTAPIEYPAYVISHYLHAAIDESGYADVLAVIFVQYLETDSSTKWKGQYVRHIYPLISLDEFADREAMKFKLDSAFTDLMNYFMSDLEGLIEKTDETSITVFPDNHLSGKSVLIGWRMTSPNSSIEAALSRSFANELNGGIHLYDRGKAKFLPSRSPMEKSLQPELP